MGQALIASRHAAREWTHLVLIQGVPGIGQDDDVFAYFAPQRGDLEG